MLGSPRSLPMSVQIAPLVLVIALLAFAWALNVAWVFILCALLTVCELAGAKKQTLEGRVMLVTGGSSGIGKAIARVGVEGGARVVICARDQARLDVARRELESQVPGAVVDTVSVDLTRPHAEVEAALRSNGDVAAQNIDYAVMSAGDSGPAAFEDTSPADWERLLRLNVLGCVWTARAVLPGMRRRRRGRLAFISSMAGQAGVYGYSAYCASKFALRGLAESLRMELKPYMVGVSLVVPPDTDTPLLARENETKPVECKRISEGAGLVSAENVAKAAVHGMLAGHSVIGFGIDGFMLNHLTVGMMPSNTWLDLLTGVFVLPIFRLIGRGYTAFFDHICAEEARKKPSGTGGDSLQQPLCAEEPVIEQHA
eukprot:g2399.t1